MGESLVRLRPVLLLFLAVALAAAAHAADPVFTASLRGDKEPTATGSKATGAVSIVVHEGAQTVDIAVKVSGIKPDMFAQHLAHAPVGPMHLHLYEANGNVSLLLPFPMGSAYAATADGFTYTRAGYPYAEGAAILKSSVGFDAFVAAMKGGAVVFNVHTEAFKDGEISGTVTPAG
jgi:hypothetical protein